MFSLRDACGILFSFWLGERLLLNDHTYLFDWEIYVLFALNWFEFYAVKMMKSINFISVPFVSSECVNWKGFLNANLFFSKKVESMFTSGSQRQQMNRQERLAEFAVSLGAH